MMMSMKKWVVLSGAMMGIGSAAAFAQQGPAGPGQASTDDTKCAIQHEPKPGVSAAGLLTEEYQIKGAVPGGLWLQKNKDAFYCNSGLVADGDTMCWKLVRPASTASCADLARKTTAKHTGS